mmetsp:Transcript_35707/g.57759  ORF Transcript_35707/g.57759 Transcript_35707/m.57759 type:complete len:395 (-) Transcript_35707:99-1283(-)|eukprot:CAMPEP_0184646084 /NCGR_PEP_ID=MMETSP0308-20130426/2735_1 /TAXON_ID=38269 /ORGANISM="Gloeochaete witrockiana, Strain SAG 46.84" /LENGTH=394 /DNA_ID=CAMNT_0027075769 /DNA_START=40 /DNA_END=1224 /DNA_ORIENTATION=-
MENSDEVKAKQPTAHFENGVQWKDLDVKKFLAIGSALYILESAVFYPLDVIKTRQQAQRQGGRGPLTDWYGTLQRTMKTEGSVGLYRGFWTSAIGSLPSQAVYLLSYNFFKDRFNALNHMLSSDPLKTASVVHSSAGAAADILSNLFYVPIDVVVSRIQVHGPQQMYASGWDAFRTIYGREGIRGLYRGLGLTIAMYAPASAIWWMTYEQFKEYFYHVKDPFAILGISSGDAKSASSSTKSQREFVSHVVAGSCAGVITATLTNPLDVIKTRIQTDPHPNPNPNHPQLVPTHAQQTAATHVVGSPSSRWHWSRSEVVSRVVHVFKTEGPKAFLKGLGPRLVYATTFSGVSSFLYEQVLDWSRVRPVTKESQPIIDTALVAKELIVAADKVSGGV